MSVAELKTVVDQTTNEERLFLQAYLDHLDAQSSPENARELDRRWEEMNAGDKVSLDEARRLHEALQARGL